MKSAVTGISTGFPSLDAKTTGLHDGELIILAARPAMGKTAFALNIASNIGKLGETVAASHWKWVQKVWSTGWFHQKG